MKVIMDEQKVRFVVSGYVFYDEESAKKAEKEISAVAYTRDKLDMNNPDAVLLVYNRIVRERMFSTPIGYEYLTNLESYLKKAPEINNKEILRIGFKPTIVKEEDLLRDANKKQEKAKLKQEKKESKLKGKEEKKSLKLKRRHERTLHKKNKIEKEPAGGDQIERLRGSLVTSLIVNVILLLAIAAMFILVQKSDVPTIIDYENKLIDRYEEWQKNLEEREAIIRDYEEKYNIDNGFNTQ